MPALQKQKTVPSGFGYFMSAVPPREVTAGVIFKLNLSAALNVRHAHDFFQQGNPLCALQLRKELQIDPHRPKSGRIAGGGRHKRWLMGTAPTSAGLHGRASGYIYIKRLLKFQKNTADSTVNKLVVISSCGTLTDC